jgi:hypothetical protein
MRVAIALVLGCGENAVYHAVTGDE